MYAHAHHEREAQSPLRPGSRAHLKTLDALSCYLSLIFKLSDTKWDKIKPKSIKYWRGGGGNRHPPLDLPLYNIENKYSLIKIIRQVQECS